MSEASPNFQPTAQSGAESSSDGVPDVGAAKSERKRQRRKSHRVRNVTVTKDPDPAHHLSPWKIEWLEDVPGCLKPARRRRWRETKAAADALAAEVREQLSRRISPTEIAEIARIVAGTEYSAVDLVKAGLEHLRSTKATAANPTATFKEAATLLKAHFTEQEGKLAPVTLKNNRSILKSLENHFGERLAALIPAKDVKSYLEQRPDRKGVAGKAGPECKNKHLIVFRMALRQVGVEKPVPTIEEYEVPLKEVPIFSNEEVRIMYLALRPCERGQVALALHGFVRPEATERLRPEHINLQRGTLFIPPHIAKDRKEHWLPKEYVRADGGIVCGLPTELFVWLKAYPFQPRRWEYIQKKLRKALGGRWIQDGLRHTGASNYNAIHGLDATAKMLTHAGEKIAAERYIRSLLPEHATEFYSILPQEFENEIPPSTTQKRVLYPPDEDLRRQLETTPVRTIAKSIGCSDVALAKHCRRHGIPLPKVGHWQKVRWGKVTPPECSLGSEPAAVPKHAA